MADVHDLEVEAAGDAGASQTVPIQAGSHQQDGQARARQGEHCGPGHIHRKKVRGRVPDQSHAATAGGDSGRVPAHRRRRGELLHADGREGRHPRGPQVGSGQRRGARQDQAGLWSGQEFVAGGGQGDGTREDYAVERVERVGEEDAKGGCDVLRARRRANGTDPVET
eukprot:ctg_809.g390